MSTPTITMPRPIAVSTNEVEPGSSQRNTSATAGPMVIPIDQAKLYTFPQECPAYRRNASMKFRKSRPSIAASIGRMIVLSIPKRPDASPERKTIAASAHSSAVMRTARLPFASRGPASHNLRAVTGAATRALAWRNAQHAAVCAVLEPWAHGTVARATRYPNYWDFNVVRVEEDPGMGAEELIAFADEALAGLEHRRVDFDVAGPAARV